MILTLKPTPYSNPYLRPHQFPYLHNEEVGQRSSKTPSSQALFGSTLKNWDEWWAAGEAPRAAPRPAPEYGGNIPFLVVLKPHGLISPCLK